LKRSVTAKRFQRFNEIRLPLRSIVLAAFFLLGVMFGYVAAQRAKSVVGEELAAYLQRFAELANGSLPGASLIFETLGRYIESVLIVLILGFSFVGTFLLPLFLAAQAFLFSFSFFSFSAALGQTQFFAVILLFAARFMLLPFTFLLAVSAMEKSLALLALSFGKGKRIQAIRYDAAYWSRYGIVLAGIVLAVIAELWLLPHFFHIFL